ncbi:hypothetical protein EON64_19485, partial [archaeon]
MVSPPHHPIATSQFSDRGSQKAFRQAPLTWYQLMRKKFHEALLGFIPVVGHIPPSLRLCIGMLYIFLLVAVFIVLFVTGYYTDRNKVFLSPLNGTQPSEHCALVPQEHSGRFLATLTGSWQRDSNFSYPDATYALHLQATRWAQAEYASFMSDAYTSLSARGLAAVQRPLDDALLAWMGWTHMRPEHPLTRLSMHADPRVIFNRDFSVASISNGSADCLINGMGAEYEGTTGQLSALLPLTGYSALCRGMLDPRLMGYDTLARPPQFALAFDARTVSVAAVVNWGGLDGG